jgi:pyridoxine kinase
MSILSIQSHVAYGYVGNAAAVFPLQRMGFEVWPVHTVQFSNHTGYDSWTGDVFSPRHVGDVIRGVAERGVFGRCQAVLTGYVGDIALGDVVMEAVGRVRAASPQALYCCDPVMGDVDTGFYVRPGLLEFFREVAVPAADLITPNQFELEALADGSVDTLAHAVEAAQALRARGPDTVVVTSLRRGDAEPGNIEMLAAAPDGAWLVSTPMLSIEPAPNGSGDMVAALLLAHLLRQRPIAEALELATATIYAVFEATVAAASRELNIVAAQDAIAAPQRRFAARRLD